MYTDALSAPPWNEDSGTAALYAGRPASDAARTGFTAALALDDADAVTGFATAWTTPDAFPADRSYGQVAATLGPDRVAAWLCGAVQVDEPAVAPTARGTGLGARLPAAVTDAAPDGRCRLLTSGPRKGHAGLLRAGRPAPAPRYRPGPGGTRRTPRAPASGPGIRPGPAAPSDAHPQRLRGAETVHPTAMPSPCCRLRWHGLGTPCTHVCEERCPTAM
ncbi:GNAT family N-acetyltransferase [Streptomyces clavifer]|uniref:GNAT family N-acetyltransferase n=1 Tax=Streptomyces clavifer TaxID=68188 RepID=UPI0033B1C5AF